VQEFGLLPGSIERRTGDFMSRFFTLLNRDRARQSGARNLTGEPLGRVESPSLRAFSAIEKSAPEIHLLGSPAVSALAKREEIHQISEAVGAVAATAGDARLALADCAPGAGSSSVAAALVLDLTQRLRLHALLVDAEPRRSPNQLLFAGPEADTGESEDDNSPPVRRTRFARLEIANIKPTSDKLDPEATCTHLNGRLREFSATIINLGAARLNPRLLPLVRPTDSVFVVVRTGVTQRQDLLSTINVFNSINTRVSGVILNGYVSAVPPWARRFFETNGERANDVANAN
jgi:hypothetical protein